MTAGADFLKGDLYDAWLDTLDKSILDEHFEQIFDERVKEVGTYILNIKYSTIYPNYLASSTHYTT